LHPPEEPGTAIPGRHPRRWIGFALRMVILACAVLFFAMAIRRAGLELARSEVPLDWSSIRWGALGGLGTAAALAGGYFLLSDVWELRDEVASLQSTLKDTVKVTSKYQEKSDQVALVESWLSDQVDWVAELSDLAARLPDGQDATVRRLTATVNAKGNGALDLSMQVKSQEIISELENRIRGAKYTIVSKQITQNADSQEYPWQFESHIEFPIQGPGLKRFAASRPRAPESSPSDKGPAEVGEAETPAAAEPPAVEQGGAKQ